MKYYVKESARLNLLARKFKFEDYEKDGIKYYAKGDIITCLINKETREITQMGLGNDMFLGVINMFEMLGCLETKESENE